MEESCEPLSCTFDCMHTAFPVLQHRRITWVAVAQLRLLSDDPERMARQLAEGAHRAALPAG